MLHHARPALPPRLSRRQATAPRRLRTTPPQAVSVDDVVKFSMDAWSLSWRPLLVLYAVLTFNLPILLFLLANRQVPVRADLPVKRSTAEWKELLEPDAFHVLVERGTERSGTSPLNDEMRPGVFTCGGCSAPLFPAEAKYDSGTGWPSFYAAYETAVEETIQPMYMLGDMSAREVRCASCGGHLGHVFGDGPEPTRRRYCMNGVALQFKPAPVKTGEVPHV